MNKIITINLGENITLYRKNITEIDNIQLSKELWYCTEIGQEVQYPSVGRPGIQSPLCLSSKNINIVRENMAKCMFELFDKPHFYNTNEWIYISTNINTYTYFHRHTTKESIRYIKQKPDYTLCYYSKMPDSLNEGHLIFKDETGEEFLFLPKEGDLLIFDANLLHRPEINTHSNTERIVFSCNFHFLDINKTYNKKQNTLI